MSSLGDGFRVGAAWFLISGAAVVVAVAADPRPPAEPARLRVSVSPETVAAGEVARVRLELEPKDGIKINRYPKIRLQVEPREGLVGAAEAAVGNDAPPPPDQVGANYFDRVDPVVLELPVVPGARPGSHRIEGRVTYFYCVTESGFCAPSRSTVEIPLEIR